MFVCSLSSVAWGQERRAAVAPIRSIPSLPGIETCIFNAKREVSDVDVAKLAQALPGASLTANALDKAKVYCNKLVGDTWAEVSKAYLELISAAYAPQVDERGKGSAAGGRSGDIAATPAGASWEGALLSGLASFLAGRAQAETITWLLDQLREKLCGTGPNAKDKGSRWFPKTCALAEDDSGYAANPPGRIFVAAIREDVEGLPSRMVQFAVAKAKERSLPEFGDTLQFLYDAGVAVRSKRDIQGIVESLAAVIAADPYKTSCHGWQPGPSSSSPPKDGLNARCVLTTTTAVFVALYSKIADYKEAPTPDKILGFLRDAFATAKLKPRLTELYGGKLPPDVAIWFDEAKLTALQPKIQRLIDAIFVFKTAVTSADTTLPETAKEAVRRAEVLIPQLLEVTDAAMDLFDPKHVPYHTEVFAVLQATERLADTLDALLAAGRAIRQGMRPLEVVAGLSRDPRLRRQCPTAKDSIPVGCAVATAALFLEQVGDIAIKANGPLLDSVVELLYKATLQRGTLVQELFTLYGITDKDQTAACAKLPPFLCSVITNSEHVKAEVLQPLVRLLEAIQTLNATLTALTAIHDPKAALEQAPTVLLEAIAVIDAGTLLVGAHTVPYREEILVAGDAVALIVAGDYAEGLRKTIDLFALLAKEPGVTLPEGIRRYLPLAVDLASAHTPDDVQAALESAAAPVGGWRRKHYQRTASLTGFVGLTGGYETPRTEGLRSAVPSGWAAGAFASVGIDVSFPVCKNSAMGFFLSVLDLGQLTSSRLTSTVKGTGSEEVRADTAPEVNVTQVFSPGLYGHISLGDSPFTLGIGASFAPALRKYFFTDPADPATQALSTWRVGAFLAVDVTILPF